MAEYAALREEAQGTGAEIFFVDGARFRAEAELRGKWVLKGESALVDSNSPKYGEKASYYSAVCLETGESLPPRKRGWNGRSWRVTATQAPRLPSSGD